MATSSTMATSSISHHTSEGARPVALLSLSVLRSINTQQRRALSELGIHSLSDLLHFIPIHRARLLVMIDEGHLAHDSDLKPLLDNAYANGGLSEFGPASVRVIDGVGEAWATLLKEHFGVVTVADLASFAPFVEAEAMMRDQAEAFSEPASAPDELIPRAVGAVVSKARYTSFVKDRELWLADYVLEKADSTPNVYDARLIEVFTDRKPQQVALGYMVLHGQRWTSLGTQLGEVKHSLALAPGESRNLVIVDWKRGLAAARAEDTSITEHLNSLQVHTRALDEVTRATAEEHQAGRSSTASATGVSAGGAVAAGAMIGAIGGAVVGGAAGGLTGLGVDTLTGGSDAGTGTITGTITGTLAGSAVGSMAGGAAASLIMSGAGALGMIESDTEGNREIVGRLHQNIQDVTSQKASAVRSLRSTVVLEETQVENENVRTLNVTNYNHAHALTVQYFEILQRYQVSIAAGGVEAILMLPFHPLDFSDTALITDYWEILRVGIRNRGLVEGFEQLIAQGGAFDLPEEPVSQAQDPRVTSIAVSIFIPGNFSYTTFDVSLVYGAGSTHTLNAGSPDVAWNGVTHEFSRSFSGGSGPLLDDVSGIRVNGNFTAVTAVDFDVTVTTLRVSAGGEVATLSNKALDSFTIESLSAGDFDKTLPYNPEVDLEQAEAVQSQDFLIVQMLKNYLNARRYAFTRLLLSNVEPNQLRDIVESLVFTGNSQTYPLHRFIDPTPIGFTSGAVVFRLKRFAADSKYGPLPTLTSEGEELAKYVGAVMNLNTGDNKVSQLVEWMKNRFSLRGELAEIADFYDTIKTWFEENREKYMRVDEVHLPSSGLFAEAILGRSNAAEKIDLTRFFNWQDSPIPHAAPVISDVTVESRAQPTTDLTVTQSDGVLNIQAPTPLPAPTGLAATLAAVQNGGLFRDMSKSEVMGSILNQLASVAERTAVAAGTLSGEALAEALQSATSLGNTVAQGAEQMAGQSFGSLTELGGKLAAVDRLPSPSDPERIPEVDQPPQTRTYEFIFRLVDLGDLPVGGEFLAEIVYEGQELVLVDRQPGQTTGNEFHVVMNTADLKPTPNDIPMYVSVHPFHALHGQLLTFQGFETFTLPQSKTSIVVDLSLQFNTETVTASTETEAKKTVLEKVVKALKGTAQGSIGGEAETELEESGSGAASDLLEISATAREALKAMITFVGEISGEISSEEGTETSGTTTEANQVQYQVRYPTGGLVMQFR